MSVAEMLSRKKSRERRMISRQRRKEMKKARRERCQGPGEPEEESESLAIGHKEFPSISRRGGWSLQEWLQQYWPTYFQEGKDRDRVTVLSEADFEKDFLDKMETYLKSSDPALKIPKSPSGSQRKWDPRATGAIPKKTFAPASRGHTNGSSKNRSLRTVTLKRSDYKNVLSTNRNERKTKKLKVITVVRPKELNEKEGIVLEKITRKHGGYLPQQAKEETVERNARKRIVVVPKKREDLKNREQEQARERKHRLVVAKTSKTDDQRDRLSIIKKKKAPCPPASPQEQQQRTRLTLKEQGPSQKENFSSQIAEKAKELTQRYSQEHDIKASRPSRPQPIRQNSFQGDKRPSWRRFSAADMMAFADLGARRSHEVRVQPTMRPDVQADTTDNARSGVGKEEETRGLLEGENATAPQQDSEVRESSSVSPSNKFSSMASGDSFFDIADDYVKEKLAEIMYSTSLSDDSSGSCDPSNAPQPEGAEDGLEYHSRTSGMDAKDNAPLGSSQPNNRESFGENTFLLRRTDLTLDGNASTRTRFDASDEESIVAGPDEQQLASKTILRHKRRPAPAAPDRAAQKPTHPSHVQSDPRRDEACQVLASGLEASVGIATSAVKAVGPLPYDYTLARPKKYSTTFFGLTPDNPRTEGLQSSSKDFAQTQGLLTSKDNQANFRGATTYDISEEGYSFTFDVSSGPHHVQEGTKTPDFSRVGARSSTFEQWDREVETCFSSEDLLCEAPRKHCPNDEGILDDWTPVEDLSHDDSFMSFVRRSYRTSSLREKESFVGDLKRPTSSEVSNGHLSEFLTEDISRALSDVRRPQNVARVMSQGELDFGRPTRVRYASVTDAPPVPPRSRRVGSTAGDYVNGSFLKRMGVKTRVTRSCSFGGWGIRGQFKDVATLSTQFKVDDVPLTTNDYPPRMAVMQTSYFPSVSNTSTQTTPPRVRRRHSSDYGIDVDMEGVDPLDDPWEAAARHPAFARRSLISLLKTPGGSTSRGLPRTRKTVAFSDINDNEDDEDDHEYDSVESDDSLGSGGTLGPPRCPSRSYSCRLWHHPGRRGSEGSLGPAPCLRRRARSYESVIDDRRRRSWHDFPAKSGIREYMQLQEILEIQKLAWKKWKKEEQERRRKAKKSLRKEASVQYSEILWRRQEEHDDSRRRPPRVPELHEARNPRLAVGDGEEVAAATATTGPGDAQRTQGRRGSAAEGLRGL